MDGRTKPETLRGAGRLSSQDGGNATPTADPSRATEEVEKPEKKAPDDRPQTPARREESDCSFTQSSTPETDSSTELHTLVSSWEEPAPKQAGRHRQKTQRDMTNTPPQCLARTAPGSPQHHRDTVSRHRDGGSRSMAEETVWLIAAATNGKQDIPHK